jgi:hypothetical protein
LNEAGNNCVQWADRQVFSYELHGDSFASTRDRPLWLLQAKRKDKENKGAVKKIVLIADGLIDRKI